jgi:hypothetical protein
LHRDLSHIAFPDPPPAAAPEFPELVRFQELVEVQKRPKELVPELVPKFGLPPFLLLIPDWKSLF